MGEDDVPNGRSLKQIEDGVGLKWRIDENALARVPVDEDVDVVLEVAYSFDRTSMPGITECRSRHGVASYRSTLWHW